MLDRNRNGDMPSAAYKDQYEREKTLWIEEKTRLEAEIAKWKELAEANMKGWEICQRSREHADRLAL